jgi:hypothetical protein
MHAGRGKASSDGADAKQGNLQWLFAGFCAFAQHVKTARRNSLSIFAPRENQKMMHGVDANLRRDA